MNAAVALPECRAKAGINDDVQAEAEQMVRCTSGSCYGFG
jgi:hypothetical protein